QDPQRYIIGMDDSNLSVLKQRYGNHPRLYRLLEFAKNGRELNVPDPYYTKNFDYVYELVKDGCEGLLMTIKQNEGI
ncbi:MAG: low molecular weight phosphotyrosine protein phosphatase, partial [Chloroflexota bacterium]